MPDDDSSPGVPDGTVLDTTNTDENGTVVQERVVQDDDGWHKEVVDG